MTFQESSNSSISSYRRIIIILIILIIILAWGRRQEARLRPVCRSRACGPASLSPSLSLSLSLSLHAAVCRTELHSPWLRHARLRFSRWICVGCSRWVFRFTGLFCWRTHLRSRVSAAVPEMDIIKGSGSQILSCLEASLLSLAQIARSLTSASDWGSELREMKRLMAAARKLLIVMFSVLRH